VYLPRVVAQLGIDDAVQNVELMIGLFVIVYLERNAAMVAAPNITKVFFCFWLTLSMGASTGSLPRLHPIPAISAVPPHLKTMLNLVPNVMGDVKNEFLLAGKEDAANKFALGHHAVGKEMIDKVNDHLSKMVDNCDTVQGFIMKHSVGGGTGSARGC
jgi:hypothetical protein